MVLPDDSGSIVITRLFILASGGHPHYYTLWCFTCNYSWSFPAQLSVHILPQHNLLGKGHSCQDYILLNCRFTWYALRCWMLFTSPSYLGIFSYTEMSSDFAPFILLVSQQAGDLSFYIWKVVLHIIFPNFIYPIS